LIDDRGRDCNVDAFFDLHQLGHLPININIIAFWLYKQMTRHVSTPGHDATLETLAKSP
jgi:hypothetical protein